MTHTPKPIYAGPNSTPPYQPISIQEARARRSARVVKGWLAGLERADSLRNRRAASARERREHKRTHSRA